MWRLGLLFLITIFCSCDYYLINSYKNGVGYIPPSRTLGDKSFKVCYEDGIMPHYYSRKLPTKYKFGKDSLRNYFYKNYNPGGYHNESGILTLRFIVNCEGKAGRYTSHSIGSNYQEKKFNPFIADQLFELTQSLQDWQSLQIGDVKFDSYFHLGFKIENGELVEILP